MKLSKLLHSINHKAKIDDREILYITHDSRKVKKGTLYIALKGTKYDGHDFIFDAIEKGAIAVIANGRAPATDQVPIIQVKNPRETMSIVAANFFNNPSRDLQIIGITGTNGKTTTTQIINHILNDNNHSSGSLGTLGFDTPSGIKSTNFTTPESIDLHHILKIMKEGGINYVPMEISSHAIEMNRIDNININIGIFTNLGADHIDFHKNKENYFSAKLKLFKNLGKNDLAIINRDDKYYHRIIENLKCKYLSYGFNKKADLYIEKYNLTFENSEGLINYKNQKCTFQTKLLGKFNLYNILASISCALILGINLESILKSISVFKNVPGRFEKFILPNNCFAIIDYAHSPDAYESIFNNLKIINKKHKIVTVFGCGGNRDKNKRFEMGSIVEKYSDEIIITNDNPRNENPDKIINNITDGIKNKKYTVIKNRKKAIIKALECTKYNQIALILGKGIEQYQLINNNKIPHCDINIVKDYINENRN